MNKCPKCNSVEISSYRHPDSKIWCDKCGFVLREEGSSEYNPICKINYTKIKEEYSDKELINTLGQALIYSSKSNPFKSNNILKALKEYELYLTKDN